MLPSVSLLSDIRALLFVASGVLGVGEIPIAALLPFVPAMVLHLGLDRKFKVGVTSDE